MPRLSALAADHSHKLQPQAGERPTGATTPFMGLKVGITLMTRKPHRFDWWLRYHRSLGIYHVFVHVEDTPELLPILKVRPLARRVHVLVDRMADGRGERARVVAAQ